MIHRIASTCLAVIAAISCFAYQAAMGQWRIHAAHTGITRVAQTENKIYGITGGALFSIDKNDNSLEMHSKLTGLSDSDISHIFYSEYTKKLMIVYSNSNIDLISDDYEMVNISDIYRKTFNGEKNINDVFLYNNVAYLATGFGIIVLNMEKYEIADTYTIGNDGSFENIVGIGIAADHIYALGDETLKYAGTKGVNLSNYNNWKEIDIPEPTVANRQLEMVGDTVFIVKANNNLYKYIDNAWSGPTGNISSVRYDNGILFTHHTSGITTAPGMPTFASANDVTFDAGNNAVWYALTSNITRLDLNNNEKNYFAPNGPANNLAWEFAYCDGRMFFVPGGRAKEKYETPATISYFENEVWHNIWTYVLNGITPYFSATDLVDIEVDPNDKTHFFAASYGDGLYEFRNDQLYKLYNRDNREDGKGIESTFDNGITHSELYHYQRVDALQFDDAGNLWMFNTSLKAPIKILDKAGKFHYLAYHELFDLQTLERLIISKDYPNRKFISLPRYTQTSNSAVFVFDDNGTIYDISDDKTRVITSFTDQDGKTYSLADRLVRSIEQDKNGVIWVGTTEGIILINDIENIFSTDFRCHKIKIPRNDGSGLADYLLETEQINDIFVDAANRKWIATEKSGVYLVSDDGLTTIHHFTQENSLLPSNYIKSIGINDRTGEVFFGTGGGVVSYQSDSNEGGSSFSNVHAFPNPVRPEFTGIITITGLTDGANVRITDVNGNMVFETTSNGGYATWNGCRANGDRVATGIYFAHCVSEDRKDKTIVKIMIIN